MSFFDTQPVGRILNRFAKDIDNLDSRLLDALRMSLATLAQIVAAFIIVATVNRFFLIAAAGCMGLYLYMARFYRQSARSIKRHDNVLRSSLYAAFSESLAGLATIRAFQETPRFIARVESAIDLENRWVSVESSSVQPSELIRSPTVPISSLSSTNAGSLFDWTSSAPSSPSPSPPLPSESELPSHQVRSD